MREVAPPPPQSGEQTKKTLYSEKASFDISIKVKRLNSQKIIFFEGISFAPSIYVTKNLALTFFSTLTGDIEEIYNKIVCKSEGWSFF